MAVARYLTDPEPQPQRININAQGADPAGVLIDDSQPVQFNNNNSGSAISITFARTAVTNEQVFADIPNIAAGGSFTESPLLQDKAVNYSVTIGQNTYGPFAIQVGSGAFQINGTGGDPNPMVAVIPPNGNVQFASTDQDWPINWKNGNDPFIPVLTEVYVGLANNLVGNEQGGSAKNFPYTLGTSAPPAKSHRVETGGGGTIKVT